MTRQSGSRTLNFAVGFKVVAWCLPLALFLVTDCRAQVERAWTPEDSVAVRYFSLDRDRPLYWLAKGVDVSVPSPSGRYSFVLTHRGDLATDSTVFQLHVYDRKDVFKALVHVPRVGSVEPLRTLDWSSKAGYDSPGMQHPKWAADSSAILFVGKKTTGPAQAFRWEVSTGRLTQLTNEPTALVRFDYQAGGLIYEVTAQAEKRQLRYPIEPVPRDWVRRGAIDIDALNIRSLGSRTFSSFAGSRPRELILAPARDGGFWISPSGRSAATLETKGGATSFSLIDLESGQSTSLMNAPIGTSVFRPGPQSSEKSIEVISPVAFWSADGSHVVLVNSKLPYASSEGAASEAYVVSYSIADRSWEVVARVVETSSPGRWRVLKSAYWNSDSNLLNLRYVDGKGESESAVFELSMGAFKRHAGSMREGLGRNDDSDFSIVLRQAANDPPKLLAIRKGVEVVLLASDPALIGVRRAKQTTISWKEDDKTVRGGLTLPPLTSGPPYPLIVQVYEFRPDLFLPDGPFPVVDAAQALAARGFAVLQMEIPFSRSDTRQGAEEEGAGIVRRLDAALSGLQEKNFIDASRIGVTGFSRAGFVVLHALTHPSKYHFRAAICADSFTGGYPAYLRLGATAPLNVYENFERGPDGPFWAKKSEWIDYETTFNFDRLTTPTLFTQHGNATNPFTPVSLETMGGLILNDKPFEYLFLPDADHNLNHPVQRVAMMTAVVDWFSYWLKDYQDPDPTKAEQFARWEKLRRQVPSTEAVEGLH